MNKGLQPNLDYVIVGIVLCYYLALFMWMVKLMKDLRNSDSDITIKELFLVFLSFFFLIAPISAVFVIKKVQFFLLYFFQKIVEKMLNSVIGGGLFCGLLITFTVGLGYFFVVASFLFKDNQRRVAAMTGFVTGQFIMFTSVYDKPLHQGLVQPHRIIFLFLGSLFVQLLWTGRKTLHNEQFLDLDDLIIKKRRRVLRLQLEFMMSFFVQICNPYLEPDSMIPRLVNFCLSSYNNDSAKKIFFVTSSLTGWFIGHILFMIFYMKLFEFVIIITMWVRKNFFES